MSCTCGLILPDRRHATDQVAVSEPGTILEPWARFPAASLSDEPDYFEQRCLGRAPRLLTRSALGERNRAKAQLVPRADVIAVARFASMRILVTHCAHCFPNSAHMG